MTIWCKAFAIAALCSSMCAHGQQSLAEVNRLRDSPVMDAAAEPVEATSTVPASLDDALHAMFLQADVVFVGTVTKIDAVAGRVVVRFRVEQAVRGATSGATFLLCEWSGLWADTPSRYVAGERRLMLLRAPSSAGYASPVWGSLGAIRLRGDAAQQTADLRWIATEVVAAGRSMHPMTATSFPAVQRVPENSAVDGTMILDMLHAWQRAEATR